MKHPEIPSFAYRLFKWFCKDHLFEELEGDLEESFLANKAKFGLKKARRIYTREVLKMIRPTVLDKPKSGRGYQAAMIGSYVTISLRNLRRQKLFSFINIFSLSVAMSSGLLVIGMISDLLKFDEFHEHKHEIYRVISSPTYQSRQLEIKASSPLGLGPEIKRQVPTIQVTQLGRRLQGTATANDKKIYVKGIYADQHFFDFLTFDLVKGNKRNALKDPFSVLLSESFVKKTFEDSNPIGETIDIEGLGTFKVTGIVADPPQFSHLQFEAIVSLSTTSILARQGVIDKTHDQWENLDRYYNYIFIPENKEKSSVIAWLNSNAPTYYKDPDNFKASFELQCINEIVPGPNISDSIGPKMIYLPIIILSVIAAAILLSAIFNYTNLSMARSLRRAREVGVRKLNGASRASIFGQFTVEAIILSLLSLALGIVLFRLLRSGFIEILPRAEEMVSLELTPQLIGWFVLFAVATGLIAGLSPSIFFSRLSSLCALRSGKMLKALSGINFRKSLIVAQFTLSIIFVMAVVITHKQYSYSLNTDLGFNKDNILNLKVQGNDPQILKSELMKLPEVSNVSFSSYIPGVGTWNNLQLVDARNQDSIWVHHIEVDDSYLENMQIELVAGRDFVPGENDVRESSMLVNETFVKNFGLGSPSDALGTVFNIGGESVEIVGVIKDIIYANLEEYINSFVVRNTGNYQYANLKVASSDILGTLSSVEEVWDKVDANHRMGAAFMDQQIEDYYEFLVDFMKIFGFIGFLAVSISTLGLLGMAIYSTQTRMKEIGIRKTFGASEGKLIYLLSRGFFIMVMWAILIGTPICYFLFDKVILAQNVYRTQITIVEVGGSISVLLALCLVTIVTQTSRAARTNPANVLRDE
ncbi:ABC transporter permease [Ekhidna sp.]|jgi:putative ABC transport system permease protein|uniref:ABC transporter permease n=1 Tax=Ekhidna sp. TaxID=2608089 RepID=UPI0032EB30E2